jgi:hypothetical protein
MFPFQRTPRTPTYTSKHPGRAFPPLVVLLGADEQRPIRSKLRIGSRRARPLRNIVHHMTRYS